MRSEWRSLGWGGGLVLGLGYRDGSCGRFSLYEKRNCLHSQDEAT